jgi:hypothetical protein
MACDDHLDGHDLACRSFAARIALHRNSARAVTGASSEGRSHSLIYDAEKTCSETCRLLSVFLLQ